MFLEISQNSQANTCGRVSFLIKLQAAQETLAQVFSCEFWEISNNTFFIEHPWWLLLYLCQMYLNNIILHCIGMVRFPPYSGMCINTHFPSVISLSWPNYKIKIRKKKNARFSNSRTNKPFYKSAVIVVNNLFVRKIYLHKFSCP